MNADESLLATLFVCLMAAALAVPGAQKLGLGRVLGYLVAGILIGPWGLAMVREPVELKLLGDIATGMMLFLIGFQLQPEILFRLRHRILTQGLPFWVATTVLFTLVGLTCGLDWPKALAIAAALALSSHTLVSEFVESKNLSGSSRGDLAITVTTTHALLFLPLMILLPLLGFGNPLQEPVGLQSVLLDLALSALVIACGHWLFQHLLRYITATQAPELFLVVVLLMLIGVLLLFIHFGSSALLGALLAGYVMAASEFRQELASTLRPWRGMLLGFFFITLGVWIDFGLLLRYPLIVLAVLVVMLVVKLLVALAINYFASDKEQPHLLTAMLVAPAGELSFVALGIAIAYQAVDRQLGSGLVVVIALSMLLTPIMQMLYSRRRAQLSTATQAVSGTGDVIEAPEAAVDKTDTTQFEDAQPDSAIEPQVHSHVTGAPVLIAGFGRVGQTVCRLLVSAGMQPTLIDHDPERLAAVSRLGFDTYCGDALRADLLEQAGLNNMQALVIAVDDRRRSMQLVSLVQERFPHVRLIVRSADRYHQVELASVGVDSSHRENFESAVLLGEDALAAIGIDWEESERISEAFRDHEARLMDAEIERGREQVLAGEAVFSPSLALGYTQVNGGLETLLSLDSEAFARDIEQKSANDE